MKKCRKRRILAWKESIFENFDFWKIEISDIHGKNLDFGDRNRPFKSEPTHNGKFIGINGLLICFSAHTGEKMSKKTYFDMKKVDFGTFGFAKIIIS